MAVNQITKVRMPDGKEVPLVDWSHRPMYSTIDTLSAFTDQELRAFNYTESEPVSQTDNFATGAARTADIADTNISSSGEMDATEEFLVYAICVEMFQFNLDGTSFAVDVAGLPIPRGPNVALAMHRLVLELEVSEKSFPTASLAWFAAGMGPSVVSSDAIATHRTYANNGVPSREAVRDLVIPVHLGGTEDYSVILHNPDGTLNWLDDAGANDANAIMQFRIYLDGLQKRATA